MISNRKLNIFSPLSFLLNDDITLNSTTLWSDPTEFSVNRTSGEGGVNGCEVAVSQTSCKTQHSEKNSHNATVLMWGKFRYRQESVRDWLRIPPSPIGAKTRSHLSSALYIIHIVLFIHLQLQS